MTEATRDSRMGFIDCSLLALQDDRRDTHNHSAARTARHPRLRRLRLALGRARYTARWQRTRPYTGTTHRLG